MNLWYAGIPFYEAVQADAVNAHDAALPTTAAAFTQVKTKQLLCSPQSVCELPCS